MQTNQTVRILLAEDVLTDAEIVKREIRKFLPQAVFERVQTREDFHQALGQIKPDLILSDYNMPAFTGLDALKITLDVCPEVPVIIVTGSINEETAVDCLKAGAVDYVLKESLKRLGPAVMQALDQKEVKVQRRVAEERLRESEERFRRLAENAQDMIYRFELYPHIQCTYMSPASLYITGYAPEEYYADPDLVFKYVHPDDLPVLKRMIFEEENIRIPITLRYFRKDGGLIWKEQRNIPIYDEAGKLVALEGIARDVTQQKQNEQKLLQSDRVFKYAIDMFCVAGFDGYLKVLNPSWERTLDWSNDELLSKPYLEFIHPDDREKTINGIAKVVEGNEVYQFENRYLCRDGSVKWLSWNAHPIPGEKMFVAASRDMTEYKQIMEELQSREKEYHGLINGMNETIWIIDPEGKLLDVNTAAVKTLGFTRDELLEIGLPGIDRKMSKTEFFKRSKATNGDKIQIFETEHTTKSGRVIPVEISSTQIFYHGKPAILSVARDISERKNSERRVRESEERFKQISENSQEWIWEVDPQGLYTYSSGVVENILGYTPEEIVGKKFFYEMFHPEDREHFKQLAFEFFNKKQPLRDFVNRNINKAGEIIWVSTSGVPMFDDAGNLIGYRGADVNITERITQEKELRDSEEKFRSLFNDHSANKLLIDPEQGIITDANLAAAEFYGFPVEALRGMKISTINTTSPEELNEKIQGALLTRNMSYEFKHRKADGSECDVEVFISKVIIGERKFLHAIIHDITEKKRHERQLRLLNRAVEQSPVIMFITDKEGCIEYVNPTFTQITGYELEDVKGKKSNLLKSGLHADDFYKDLWDTILSGKDWKGELQNKRKDGSLYWVSAVISPIFNSEGEITHFVTVREDITEKKDMIKNLVAAKEKAEESDRLKSAFLANMSHEIRTPMNSIIGFLDLLQEPGLEEELREDYLQIVQESSDRLLNTINDIIEISKIEAGHLDVKEELIRVNGLLNYFYEFYKPEAERNGLQLRVVNRLPEDAQIKIDKNKLESILGNLIKNAVKFTANGFVELGCQMDNGQLVFYVKDSGIGIAPNRLEAIFDRFTQADLNLNRTYEGSGLGLSICKSYAELLKGRIWVESEVGQGSTFYVSIPLVVQAETNQQTTEAVTEPVADEQPDAVILIAEDDQASYYYLEVVLAKQNYQLIRARNGEEAVLLVQQHPEIQLVLMDIKMPVMDGYEATRQIRQFNTRVPIIAQTAFALSGDRERTQQSGFTDYLAKPIKAGDLVALIERYTL
ncbi:PAS domain S-box protein [Gaoshiqia sediminis]|uniref:histidine kinase n=1 Tax=Gaoshiqia sediminis TaxID=2986998 RepID=A0AA41Y8J4_9BACT|nr:PAS domain S-box protein [Gaoshiqia sediminis]MCW0481165.1 PAS domain S-box protein [Gaoshiqia sediminis]